MLDDKMRSTIQFILEQQAQYTARIQKDEERRTRLESAFLTLTELARNVDERVDTVESNVAAQNERFHAYLYAQSEDFSNRLQIQRGDLKNQLDTQRDDFNSLVQTQREDFNNRLQTQREDFDQRLNALSQTLAKTDESLDRLTNIVERYIEGRNGKS